MGLNNLRKVRQLLPCSTTAHLRKGQMFPTGAVLNRQDLKLEGYGSFM